MARLTIIGGVVLWVLSAVGMASAGQNSGATIVLDLDAATAGNQANDLQQNVGASEAVDIAVYITGAQNLKAYQVDLMFDATKVEWNAALTGDAFGRDEPNFMGSAGGAFVFGKVLKEGTTDVVTILNGITSATADNTPDGDGLIGVISFTTLGGFSTNDKAFFKVAFFEFADVNNEVDTFDMPSTNVHPGIQVDLNEKTAVEADTWGRVKELFSGLLR